MAMLAVALIAITVIERKKTKAVQEKARRALYPGDLREMVGVLTELKSHWDPESQTLAKQIEAHLQKRGHRDRNRRVSSDRGKLSAPATAHPTHVVCKKTDKL